MPGERRTRARFDGGAAPSVQQPWRALGFTADNDPHGERDFGAIYQLADGRWTVTRPARREDERESVFWKIDYFDRALEFASEDAADPGITRRVLTVMLASEY